ncbi:MAG: hypothetical protein IKC95_02495 [Oscillospiraceae bacterium]|nr:hypothetical protein [Oscillospiraceae bacterium]
MTEIGAIEIDFLDVMKALGKRLWIIVLCGVLVGTLVLTYTVLFVTPQYQASVTLYVNNGSGKGNSAISSSDLAVALHLVETYMNIIQSNRVVNKIIDESGVSLSTNQVKGMISAKAMGETEMFHVTVTSPDPELSMKLANTIADVAPAEITDIIEGSSAKIIDYAQMPNGRSSPSYTKNTILGTAIGAGLAALVIAVCHLFDMRIKREEDLTSIDTSPIGSIPILGAIPEMTILSKKAARK